MVEPTGDPTTLKKEERAMRPTPEVVRKWSSIQQAATGCTGIYQLMPQVEIFVHSMDIRLGAILPTVMNYNKLQFCLPGLNGKLWRCYAIFVHIMVCDMLSAQMSSSLPDVWSIWLYPPSSNVHCSALHCTALW